jgi:hypothetical protein
LHNLDLENRGETRQTTLWSAGRRPRGFAHRPEDPNPAEPEPAGDDLPSAAIMPARQAIAQYLPDIAERSGKQISTRYQ